MSNKKPLSIIIEGTKPPASTQERILAGSACISLTGLNVSPTYILRIAEGVGPSLRFHAALKGVDLYSESNQWNDFNKELNEIRDECSKQDWDCQGARAVNESTWDEAEKFINLLPSGTRAPEPTVEPSGCLGFEWRNSDGFLIVSVEPDGYLAFIGTEKGKRFKDRLVFDANIPSSLIKRIKSLGC